MARDTALGEAHRSLGARMIEFAGYSMPLSYKGGKAEHLAVRNSVGLFDVSHMGRFAVAGPNALALVQQIVTNNLEKLGDGRAQYTTCCREDGGILDDVICYRLSRERILVVVNATNRDKMKKHFETHVGSAAGNTFSDASDELALLALQGPDAPRTLARLLDEQIATMGPFRTAQTAFSGTELVVSTTGYTGEAGFELFVPAELAPNLFSGLMECGKPFDIQPAGLGARDTLRLEMKYCLYGNDIDETTTPLEAGLSWVVKFKKGPFVGREALLRQKRQGVQRLLIGLEVKERGIARHGYRVFASPDASESVGRVTSGTMSPSLGKAIAMAYVPTELSEVGNELYIEVRERRLRAKVVKTPFYRRTVDSA